MAFEERRSSLVQTGLRSWAFFKILTNLQSISDDKGLSSSVGLRLLRDVLDLPLELQSMIIPHVHSSAFLSPIVVLEESRLLLETTRPMSVLRCIYSKSIDLTSGQDIFLGTSYVENNAYISYLSSKRLSLEDRIVRPPAATTRIRLSSDDVGIRNIEFLDGKQDCMPSQKTVSAPSATWYRLLQSQSGTISTINGVSNDLLLGDVGIGKELGLDPVLNRALEWDTPEPPVIKSSNLYEPHPLPEENTGVWRMTWAPFEPGLRGLLVALTSDKILKIRAWHDHSDVSSITQDQSSFHGNVFWKYFPIGAAEDITNIWVRENPMRHSDSPHILVHTSSKRSTIFGPYISPHSQEEFPFVGLTVDPHADLQSTLNRNQDCHCQISGIYYSTCGPLRKGTGAFGVECNTNAKHLQNGVHCDSDQPAIGNSLGGTSPAWNPVPEHTIYPSQPPGVQNQEWFASTASMEGIEKLEMCRDPSHQKVSYIGLLLHYPDRCESVGQWRWDCQIDTLSRADGDTWLSFKWEGTSEEDHVACVEFGAGKKMTTFNNLWVNVPLSSDVIWWFGHKGNRVWWM